MTNPDPVLRVLEYVRDGRQKMEAAFLPRPGRWRVYRDSHGWVAEPPSDSWHAFIWPIPHAFLTWEAAYVYADSRARPRQLHASDGPT